ncbi:hypothetical protein CLOM_g4560, partial [Closterium sp. NIES-68]
SSTARLASMKVLLVHAGGDSKRLPWANPCGKPFVPFPLLAGDDPDGPPLTLFDHILAVSALALQALPPNEGALFIMTGDVLPCFNASRIHLPSHGALVVTAAVPLDVASRHGVILASDQHQQHQQQQQQHQQQQQQQQQQQHQNGIRCDKDSSPQLVADLLQKPSVADMVEKGALCGVGGALLDTGHLRFESIRGARISMGASPPCLALLSALGSHLLAHLSSHSLFHHCADGLSFLHFGTSSEYLYHIRLAYSGRMPRRHLCVVPAPTECHVAESAALISSHVHPFACVGEGSVVSDSTLVPGTRVGDRCVVIGVDTAAAESAFAKSAECSGSAAAESAASGAPYNAAATTTIPLSHRPPTIPSTPFRSSPISPPPPPPPPPPLVLPSHMCLWQVPLKGGREVTLCCGVDDNPKLSLSGGGSFCGRPWKLWLRDRGLLETDVWPDTDNQGRPIHLKQDLWNALLFPILPRGSGLPLAMWLLGTFPPTLDQASDQAPSQALSQQQAATWRRSDRTSLALLHSQIDFPALLSSALHRRSLLLSAFARAAIDGGSSPGDAGARAGAGATIHGGSSPGDAGASAAIEGGCSPADAAAAAGGSLGRNFASLTRQLLLADVVDSHHSSTCHVAEPHNGCHVASSSFTGDGTRAKSNGSTVIEGKSGARELCRELSMSFPPVVGREGVGPSQNRRAGVSGDKGGGVQQQQQQWFAGVPRSRVLQAKLDLVRAGREGQGEGTGKCKEGGGEGEGEGKGEGKGEAEGEGKGEGEGGEEEDLEEGVWRAVAEEAAVAVGVEESGNAVASCVQPKAPLSLGASVTVTLPVRLDIAGGWSDTPPWSLERCGTVLNMAVVLEGKRPVGATVTVVNEPGVRIDDDHGASLHITDPATIPPHLSPQEPFVIVKAALLITGIPVLLSSSSPPLPSSSPLLLSSSPALPSSSSPSTDSSSPSHPSSSCFGLHIRTWADVPRGSGLGTSSIVAAALVKALLLLMRGGGGGGRTVGERSPGTTDEAPEAAAESSEAAAAEAPENSPGATKWAPEVTDEEVSRLVLLLEQRMGTGGGWQDQVGGLYPGVKCTTSLPTCPIRLVVDPLLLLPALCSALQQRLVVVFVGQVRLARNVLKNVVTRYLQRDSRLISTIQRLTDLAEIGRRAISTADLDLLGRVLSHTWDLHQELDPHCSNPHVDALLAAVHHLSCGAKLAGAGGGGFAMIMGRSGEAADEIKGILRGMGEPVRVYDWAVAV